MKALCVALCVLWPVVAFAEEPTFRWTLPSVADVGKLTPQAFPGSDAVILVKEQGYTEGTHTQSLFAIYNDVTVTTRSMVVKVLNERGVEKFGTFSYEYPYMVEKLERHVFKVKARVMKPDGTVEVLPDSAIKQVKGVSTAGGRAVTEKVMFKFSNLAPGDVVQYEYAHAQPFSYKRQALFYYHDRYPVLRSVAYVNMAKNVDVQYMHFPPDQFGPPEVKDLGNAISSVWTLRNLPAIPDEPYGRPLSEVSYITTVVNWFEEEDGNGWRPVAKDYYRRNIENGSVSKSFMEDLGLNPSLEKADWPQIDTLYTALRRYFRLKEDVSRYTDYRQVDRQVERKEADATDLAFIMAKALDRWNVRCTPVLMRDRREGEYELTVPSLVWFSRLGLLVSHGGKDVIYDFDPAIPSRYETPWFINPSVLFAVQDTGGCHVQLKRPSTWREHISTEVHRINLSSGKRVLDSVCFTLKGAAAQNKRSELHAKSGEDLDQSLETYLEENVLQDVERCEINDFLNEPVIRLAGVGSSRGTSAAIDSFLTYQPRNHFLRSFRESFALPQRHYDIVLEEPFAYNMQWWLAVPPHYEIERLPEASQIAGPAGATAQVSYMKQGKEVEVNAIVVFASGTVPLAAYAEWRAFLDKVNTSMERQLVFRKAGVSRATSAGS